MRLRPNAFILTRASVTNVLNPSFLINLGLGFVGREALKKKKKRRERKVGGGEREEEEEKRHTPWPRNRHRRLAVNEQGRCGPGAVADIDCAHCG